MGNLSRENRLIENEVIFRDVNENIKDFLEDEFGSKDKQVSFYCECSKPNCIERIDLTLQEYDELHKNSKQFVTLIGHEFLEVEKIIRKYGNYQIVEKHFQPPKAENINLALKSISSQI